MVSNLGDRGDVGHTNDVGHASYMSHVVMELGLGFSIDGGVATGRADVFAELCVPARPPCGHPCWRPGPTSSQAHSP
ncbi:hypothetical protein FMEAI12_3950008 [Parafrankia sp. Ea1.12]|uniref:hypothetical protein n=1 Tax=Parafrankia sp. Ea1.12 TaxID=573499 RepID=UPI000DA48BBF|nr:hypothetical protein [Parafrankia sp. Ea1.12]SQD97178.1 hypothetical protein FMEAI12_3950008 [Parafrankia sp. Ea1.12]